MRELWKPNLWALLKCQSTLKREKSVLGDLPMLMQAGGGRAGNAARVARVIRTAQR